MAEQNRLQADGIYHPIGGMNIDSNGISAEELEAMDIVNCRVYQSKVIARKGSTKLSAVSDPTEPILEYHRYVDPVSGAILFAFCANTIWRYVSSGTGWQDVSNSLITSKNFDQWSVTSAIDETVGATVVAAGSTYARPNDPQSGGSARVLLYWDRTAGTYGQFATLSMTNELPIAEENTGVWDTGGATITGPELGASDSLTTTDNYDPNFVSYVAGSMVLSTIQSGIIAYAGEVVYEIGGVDCYRWIPTNTTNIIYGDTSYIKVDGSSWQVEFDTTVYQDEIIFIAYSYNADIVLQPTYVAFFHNSLILANTFEETVYVPWRLRWCVPSDIFKTKASDYMDVAVGDITPILELKVVETTASSTISSYLYIYKQNSIVRGSYNTSYNTDPDIIAPFLSLDEAYSEGIETVRTLQVINGTQIYLGRNDIYAFNGYERQSLTLNSRTGASRIREYLFDSLDLDNLNLCFSVYDEDKKQYMLFVKFLSDSTDYPTNVLLLDMERGTWTRHTVPECSAAIAADFTPNASIDSLPGNIEDLEGNIEDLAGNTTKLVLLAMTQISYIQGVGAGDKTDSLGIKMYFEPGANPWYLEPTTTLSGGKFVWEQRPVEGISNTVTILWDSSSSKWLAYSGGVYTTSHPTAAGQKPPETGWDNWDEIGTPTTYAPEGTYYDISTSFDSYFITRDFVGGTLENQDRTQLVYVEGSRGSVAISCNTDYSLSSNEFSLIEEKTFPLVYSRRTFSPDKTANNIRFLVQIKDGAIFRWMQVFSIRQDLTNI